VAAITTPTVLVKEVNGRASAPENKTNVHADKNAANPIDIEFSMTIRGRERRWIPTMAMLSAAAKKPKVGPNHRARPKLATELTDTRADVPPNVKRTANQSLAMSNAKRSKNPVALEADSTLVDGKKRFKPHAKEVSAAVNVHVRTIDGVKLTVGIAVRRCSTLGRILSTSFMADSWCRV